jgi:pyruvate formate lyase activating enzyme
VRTRHGDAMMLTTYGRSSGFCIDPIEKKPLNHFLPGSAVLSFGTAGCNLTCKFCQNWDISKASELDLLQEQASPESIAAAAEAAGARLAAFTYNDPVGPSALGYRRPVRLFSSRLLRDLGKAQ